MRMSIEEAEAGILRGDKRSLARVLSWIEDETTDGRALLDRLYPRTGRAYKVGITGAPGSGKSTLTDLLCRLLRARGETVGVLAVDPSSPFSGGAILGDRIRMQTLAADAGVFIRSMASRGSLGGLAASTQQATEALDAFGCQWILIETVGVGQSEMEVVGVADTTLLVLVPESGDGVQVMKAGLMEAGDIYVINKYDREGGDRIEKEIHLLLGVLRERRAEGAWLPPIVPTIGIRDQGGEELIAAIEAHRRHREADPESASERRAERARQTLRLLLRSRLLESAWSELEIEARFSERLPEVLRREVSPYRLVDALLAEVWSTTRRGGS
ncbi:MAG: methylmalonyl Co-A mutase-associated GTPase MeaB [Candidatus Eisenbacteria bacterium]